MYVGMVVLISLYESSTTKVDTLQGADVLCKSALKMLVTPELLLKEE